MATTIGRAIYLTLSDSRYRPGQGLVMEVTEQRESVIENGRKYASEAVHSLMQRSLFLEIQQVLTLLRALCCSLNRTHLNAAAIRSAVGESQACQ